MNTGEHYSDVLSLHCHDWMGDRKVIQPVNSRGATMSKSLGTHHNFE